MSVSRLTKSQPTVKKKMKANKQLSAGSVCSCWIRSTSEAAPMPSSSGCWTTIRSWQGCCWGSCCLRYQHTHTHTLNFKPKFIHVFSQLECEEITAPNRFHWLNPLWLRPQFKPLVIKGLNLSLPTQPCFVNKHSARPPQVFLFEYISRWIFITLITLCLLKADRKLSRASVIFGCRWKSKKHIQILALGQPSAAVWQESPTNCFPSVASSPGAH